LLPRRSCSFKCWSPISLLHSWRICCFLSSIRHLGAPLSILSQPGPWRPCPLHGAGMAWQVIPLWVAANFFQGPPSPWVRSCICH
jgi:hypothetical protein